MCILPSRESFARSNFPDVVVKLEIYLPRANLKSTSRAQAGTCNRSDTLSFSHLHARSPQHRTHYKHTIVNSINSIISITLKDSPHHQLITHPNTDMAAKPTAVPTAVPTTAPTEPSHASTAPPNPPAAPSAAAPPAPVSQSPIPSKPHPRKNLTQRTRQPTMQPHQTTLPPPTRSTTGSHRTFQPTTTRMP